MYKIILLIFFCTQLYAQKGLVTNTRFPNIFHPNSIRGLLPLKYDSTDINVTSTFYFNQIYYNKINSTRKNDVGNWDYRIYGLFPVALAQNTFYIQSGFIKSKKYILAANGKNKTHYVQNFDMYFIGLKTPVYYDVFNFELGVTLKRFTRDYIDYYFAINMAWKWIFLKYSYSTKNDLWDFKAENISGVMQLNKYEERRNHAFELKYDLDETYTLQFGVQFTDHNSGVNPTAKENVLLPKGSSYILNGSAAIANVLGFDEIKTYYYQNELNSDGYFYSDKAPFGKLTKNTFSTNELTLELKKETRPGLFSSKSTIGKSSQTLNGYIDTWTFTDFWTDFLGIRYFGQTFYKYQFLQSGLSYGNNINSKVYLGLDITYERIVIDQDSYIKTWISELLLVQDLKKREADLSYQQGIYVTPKFEYEIMQNLKMTYIFSQYIPIPARGSKKQTKSSPKSKGLTYGGGRHLFEVTFSI